MLLLNFLIRLYIMIYTQLKIKNIKIMTFIAVFKTNYSVYQNVFIVCNEYISLGEDQTTFFLSLGETTFGRLT